LTNTYDEDRWEAKKITHREIFGSDTKPSNIIAPPCPWGPPPGWTGTAEEKWDLSVKSMNAFFKDEKDYFTNLKEGKSVSTSGSAFEGSKKEVVDLDTITTYDNERGVFNNLAPKKVPLTRWQRIKQAWKGESNE